MDRRSFLFALPFIPLAAKAAVAAVSQPSSGRQVWLVDWDDIEVVEPLTPESMDALIDRAHRRQLDEYVRQFHERYGL